MTNFRHPKEREIWWCILGVNVGTEIYGKGTQFMRPVLVVRVVDKSCVVIPLSSKIKKRKYSSVIETEDGLLHTALVLQVKNVDKRRFAKKIYKLGFAEYGKVKIVFDSLFKI